MKFAVIDIGTNSVKLTMGEQSGGSMKILFDINAITKLGEGLASSGRLSDAAMARTAAAVEKFSMFAYSQGAAGVICCGTMAMRTAANGRDFAKYLKSIGCPNVEIISGDKEAELSAHAVINNIEGASRGNVVIFDTGGGSTEFIRVQNGEIKNAVSLPIGAVTLTDECFSGDKIDEKILCSTVARLTKEIHEAAFSEQCDTLIATGGNITALAMVALKTAEYSRDKIHGMTLTLDEILSQAAMYAKCTREERKHITGLNPARADIITAGSAIAAAAVDASGLKELTVSDSSMRHEVLRSALANLK